MSQIGSRTKHTPYPVFSPLDEIKVRTPRLGDYNCVSTCVNWTVCKYAQMLPFTGSRWYRKGACEYTLETISYVGKT